MDRGGDAMIPVTIGQRPCTKSSDTLDYLNNWFDVQLPTFTYMSEHMC